MEQDYRSASQWLPAHGGSAGGWDLLAHELVEAVIDGAESLGVLDLKRLGLEGRSAELEKGGDDLVVGLRIFKVEIFQTCLEAIGVHFVLDH